MTDDFEGQLALKIAAYHDAALLHAAIVLGLPERMEKRGVPADTLAAELGLSAPHLRRLLRGLASLGICAEAPDGTFALTPQGRSLLPGARLRQKVQIVVAQYWRPLGQSRRFGPTGQTRFRAGLRPERCGLAPRPRRSRRAVRLLSRAGGAGSGSGHRRGARPLGRQRASRTWRRLWRPARRSPASQSRSSRHPVRSPAPDRGGVAVPSGARRSRSRRAHRRRSPGLRSPSKPISMC